MMKKKVKVRRKAKEMKKRDGKSEEEEKKEKGNFTWSQWKRVREVVVVANKKKERNSLWLIGYLWEMNEWTQDKKIESGGRRFAERCLWFFKGLIYRQRRRERERELALRWVELMIEYSENG